MSQEELILTSSQDEELARMIEESAGVAFDPSTILQGSPFELDMVDQKPCQAIVHDLEQQQYLLPYAPAVQINRPIPTREHYSGELHFSVILDTTDSKSYAYSQRLKKVFILMETTLPIKFSWIPCLYTEYNQLWVRATMLYKLDQHRSVPVNRCLNHRVPENNSNSNIPEDQRIFVMRCDSNLASVYETQPNNHLSIVTPLQQPQVGIDYVTVDYKFYCKNSCSSGMNRRPTEIIFTLETGPVNGEVIGRQSLEVRICSCPKRDREKEEAELDRLSNGGKKRKLQPAKAPPGKKIMTDNKVYKVEFNVVGRENYVKVLHAGFDGMAGSAYRSGNSDMYKPYLEELHRLMNIQL